MLVKSLLDSWDWSSLNLTDSFSIAGPVVLCVVIMGMVVMVCVLVFVGVYA